MNIKLTKSDAYIIALFFVIAIPITITGYSPEEWPYEAVLDTLVYCIFCFLVAYIIVFKLFPRFFPQKKILQLFFWTVLIMMIFGVLEIILYILIDGQKTISEVLSGKPWYMWAVSTSAENAGILIGILLGKKFYEAQLDLQTREKEKKESELRLLKSQIDPHFLFNNLNTVDSLIDTDPQVAKEYLNKLAKLYRYLIHTKEDEVVPLEDELDFAQNYIFLMNKRYGNIYQFEVNQQSNIDNHLIPPGALQTLLENVVKHNIGDSQEPVVCQIEIQNDKIIVRNNVRLKNEKADSTGTGLNNLLARYALLSDKEVKIQSGSDYIVELPLIKNIDS